MSDHYALEFMRFLQGQGIRVPEDVQIIGFDDTLASRESVPALTTIHQDAALRARTAIRRLEVLRDGTPCDAGILVAQFLGAEEHTEAWRSLDVSLVCGGVLAALFLLTAGGFPAQDEFTLPNIHYPKIINMLLLCISRKKYAAEAAFSGEQQTVLQASAEYKFICRLHCRLPEHFRQAVQENEMLMLTALLLCFEDENFCLQRSAAGTFCVQKAQEFAQYLQRYFDIRSSLFDETFYRGIASIFYRLQNQRQFSVINDREATSGVSRLGIGTGNLCLGFARFFEENFGFALEQNDALESFYILNSIISRMPRHYYCPRVLVVSEFGVSCAQSVAARLQMYYADQLGTVKSSSFKNLLRMDLAGWDLLLTDMSRKKTRRYLKDLPIPVLTIEFTLKYASCPELDIWLETHRQDMETAVLNDHCFYRTRLPDKEAVFRWLVQHFAGGPELQGLSLEEELHRNDRLMNQQRKNSLVFLPVLLAENCKPRIAVLINDHPFLWNDQPAQIFIFYEHPRSRTQERILSVILHKLLYMSPQTRTDLLESQLENPLLVLYPNE